MPVLMDINEGKENDLSFDEFRTQEIPFEPSSIKSAPVFADEQPISYEDFGSGIDRRHARRYLLLIKFGQNYSDFL